VLSELKPDVKTLKEGKYRDADAIESRYALEGSPRTPSDIPCP